MGRPKGRTRFRDVKRLTCYIPMPAYVTLQELAAARLCSVSAVVREAVGVYLAACAEADKRREAANEAETDTEAQEATEELGYV